MMKMKIFDPIKAGWVLHDKNDKCNIWKDTRGRLHYVKFDEVLYQGCERDMSENPDAVEGAASLIDNRKSTR